MTLNNKGPGEGALTVAEGDKTIQSVPQARAGPETTRAPVRGPLIAVTSLDFVEALPAG